MTISSHQIKYINLLLDFPIILFFYFKKHKVLYGKVIVEDLQLTTL